MFMLVWEWWDENTNTLREHRVNWFHTKEELLEAYHSARMEYAGYIDGGVLLLSAAVNYSWADIERLF